ncbi:MAG: hypothetical protein RL743_1565, partial [Actinomycetota bacterium]
VDLALLPMSDLFTSNPTSLFEFKLWFTADALDDTKFKDETRSNDSITKSLIIDSNKMRSVRPELPGNDFIVTFLNTVHIDRISGAVDKRLAAHLKSIGVGYSNVHARPSLVSMGSDAVRSEGIKRAMREILPIAPSVTHVECGQWEWNDLKLSVDCLVNEVLPRNEALRG